MHHCNASAKKPLHYILYIFPWKVSIGSWVKDLPVTHFQNDFWMFNPLIFIPSQNPLRISLIHALYTTVNFLRANGGGTKPPDPVLQLCGLCNSLDLIVMSHMANIMDLPVELLSRILSFTPPFALSKRSQVKATLRHSKPQKLLNRLSLIQSPLTI